MDRQAIISFFDNLIKPGDKRNRIVAIWTAVFLTAAHAFRWFNTGFNHDSLKVLQYDANWQAYLGRYLAPIYLLVRGEIRSAFPDSFVCGSFPNCCEHLDGEDFAYQKASPRHYVLCLVSHKPSPHIPFCIGINRNGSPYPGFDVRDSFGLCVA